MHHDVAPAMIIDPVAIDKLVYANPLRTNLHNCDIMFAAYNSLLNSPRKSCPYHTCCVPYADTKYCADAPFLTDSPGVDIYFRAEECDGFMVEHHHRRLPYCGVEEVAAAARARGEPEPIWRPLRLFRGELGEWFHFFAHSVKHRAGWEQRVFEECETLFRLAQDTMELHNTLNNLKQSAEIVLERAKDQVGQSENEFNEQRRVVFELFDWAMQGCDTCPYAAR